MPPDTRAPRDCLVAQEQSSLACRSAPGQAQRQLAAKAVSFLVIQPAGGGATDPRTTGEHVRLAGQAEQGPNLPYCTGGVPPPPPPRDTVTSVLWLPRPLYWMSLLALAGSCAGTRPLSRAGPQPRLMTARLGLLPEKSSTPSPPTLGATLVSCSRAGAPQRQLYPYLFSPSARQG